MHLSRALSSIAALSMILSMFSLISFSASSQPGAQLLPPASEFAYDADSDGLYDYLLVNITVEVYEAGDYSVAAKLNDSLGTHIYGIVQTGFLDVGMHVMSMSFEGRFIWSHGVDGPYIIWATVSTDGLEPPVLLDQFEQYTAPYAYAEFEAPPALFTGTYTVSGRDVDGNGRYEFLDIKFDVEAFEAKDFQIRYSMLWYQPPSGVVYFADGEMPMYLDVGVKQLTITLRGSLINAAEVNGPYQIYLTVCDIVDEVQRYLDELFILTDDYDYREFEAGSIISTWSSLSPAIDGSYGVDEWNDATLVDLGRPDMENPFDATILVKNNMTHLYFCIDVLADLTEDSGDYAAIAFDSGNDNRLTDGSEDQFVIGSVPGQTIHQVYSESAMDWVIHCEPFDGTLPDHDGLAAAAGFGTSAGSEDDHRVYELAIPLDLIGVTPGSVVGFATNGIESRGIFDANVDNGSSWPYFMDARAPLADYGDLTIGWSTIASISGVAGENGWYISSVDVELNSTSSAGVDDTFYSLNSGDWQTYTSKFTIDTEGHNTLAYYSVDLYGSNETIKTTQVSIDTVAPESSIVMTGIVGSDGWFTSMINVALDATDSASGVESITYALDDAQWNAYEAEFVIDEDGSHALLVRSEDAAGNIEETQLVEFRIDTTEPSLLILSPDEGTSIRGNDVTVSWESSDNILINATEVSIDGNEWSVVDSTDADGVLNMRLGHGEHTVQLRVTDSAGNTNVSSVTFHINSSALSFSGPYYGLPLIGVIAVIVAAVAVIGNRLRGRRSGASVPSSKNPDGDSSLQP